MRKFSYADEDHISINCNCSIVIIFKLQRIYSEKDLFHQGIEG